MLKRVKQLWRDRRGVAAVEFAFIAPILILAYLGLAEMTTAMMAERRASHVAAAIADVVAQSTTMKQTDIDDIFKLGDEIVKPFPEANLKICVAAMQMASGTTTVIWTKSVRGPTGCPAQGATVTPPAGLITDGQGLIMTRTQYHFDSPVGRFLPNGITFDERFYLRPRKSETVTWTS
jgi:Flp pilus assembly protein TadG